MGFGESMCAREVWPLSIRGQKICSACPRRGKMVKRKIVSLPYNWPFIVGNFCFVERCYDAYKAFQKEHCMHIDLIYY
jgi:hypothetical protein